jgi:hypothetical protein
MRVLLMPFWDSVDAASSIGIPFGMLVEPLDTLYTY